MDGNRMEKKIPYLMNNFTDKRLHSHFSIVFKINFINVIKIYHLTNFSAMDGQKIWISANSVLSTIYNIYITYVYCLGNLMNFSSVDVYNIDRSLKEFVFNVFYHL